MPSKAKQVLSKVKDALPGGSSKQSPSTAEVKDQTEQASPAPVSTRAEAPTGLKLPTHGAASDSPTPSPAPKTPKTPADEAVNFFSNERKQGEKPVQVWELVLEDDGGPGEGKSVSDRLDQRHGPPCILQPCEELRVLESSETLD
jgi:hypothetical protein